MKKMITLCLGIAVGVGLAAGAMKYTVVNSKQGIVFVPKRSATFSNTYVDTREWGFMQWAEHPDLALSLTQNGRSDVVENADTLQSTLNGAFRSLK